MMRCAQVRDHLVAPGDGSHRAGLDQHLAGCPDCSRFHDRLELVRRTLREDRPSIEPDPGFAARVAARIDQPAEVLAWAALRLLPAALVILIALAALISIADRAPAEETVTTVSSEPASSDLLVWLAESPGEEP
jgi:hypothetical protein